jgi:hypothetical protein
MSSNPTTTKDMKGTPMLGFRRTREIITPPRIQYSLDHIQAAADIMRRSNGAICPNINEIIVPLKRRTPTRVARKIEIESFRTLALLSNIIDTTIMTNERKIQTTYALFTLRKLIGRRIARGIGYRKVSFA